MICTFGALCYVVILVIYDFAVISHEYTSWTKRTRVFGKKKGVVWGTKASMIFKASGIEVFRNRNKNGKLGTKSKVLNKFIGRVKSI